MLKDITESKRVDRVIHTRANTSIHPKILSRFFWPPLREEKLIMPLELQEQFNIYEIEYARIKRGRKLAWMDHLGTVEVEIELADREISLEVTPLQASVLYAFENHGISRKQSHSPRSIGCGQPLSTDWI
jgi:anaphase-promoting complex subunit 2